MYILLMLSMVFFNITFVLTIALCVYLIAHRKKLNFRKTENYLPFVMLAPSFLLVGVLIKIGTLLASVDLNSVTEVSTIVFEMDFWLIIWSIGLLGIFTPVLLLYVVTKYKNRPNIDSSDKVF